VRLLALITWPYVRRHAFRTCLTTIGVVLGIAVFVGMHTANQRVVAAFSDTIDRIAGKTDLQITAGEAGFPEDVLEAVQAIPSVRVAVPVIEAIAGSRLEGVGDLMILAVDMTGDRSLRAYDFEGGEDDVLDDPLVFLAQPDSLIVSKELASTHGLSVGSHLVLETALGDRQFTVRGIMKPQGLATAFGGNLAVMDVFAAQRMFGRGRTFDRIDVAIQSGVTVKQVERDLAAALGPGYEVQPPASRSQQASAMVAGYSTVVNLSSAFALFIGMFIVHSSFVTAVTQRRHEIGILRALGATRTQIRRLFLAEGLMLGLIGSAIGVAIGTLVARAVTTVFAQLAAELYGVAQQPARVAFDNRILMLAALVGTATSVIAAVLPATQAARIEPIEALQQNPASARSNRRARQRVTLFGVLTLSAIALVATPGPRWLAYGGYLLTIVAALVIAPVLSGGLVRLLRPVLRAWWPVEGSLAGDSLLQAPQRTSGAILALMFSLAMAIAFAGMAGASYASVTQWLDATLNCDLFIMPSQRLDLRTTRFPADMADEIAAVPGVSRVQRYRNSRASFQGRPVMVAALEMASVAQTARPHPVAGHRDLMYTEAAAGRGVLVSENLAQLQHLTLGEQIELPAPGGVIRLPIVGILPDYTDQQGTIFLDRALFVKFWRDDAVSDFRVFVTPGSNVADVRRRIMERYAGRRHVFVLTNEEGRRYVLRIADGWFRLVDVQIGIAVLVAILGIVNALTVSIADRRREIGVLQAVGALRRQVRRMIWLEAMSIAVIGLVLGAGLGAVMLRYLLDVMARDAFGLHLEYLFPAGTVAILVPVMLVVAVVAALWPSETAVRTSLVEALEYE
jgi:putative ABC transport system permease protein